MVTRRGACHLTPLPEKLVGTLPESVEEPEAIAAMEEGQETA